METLRMSPEGGGGRGRGLTQRSRQVLPAQDLFVQLFCLLVLVLF